MSYLSKNRIKGVSRLYLLPPTLAEVLYVYGSDLEGPESAFKLVSDLDELKPEILRRKFSLPANISANMGCFDLSTLLINIKLGGDAGALKQDGPLDTDKYLERIFNQVSPKTILESEDHYVECKSLSVLTVTYLRKAGIPSRFAVFLSSPPFRHMVVEEWQKSQWKHLDPTKSLEGKLYHGESLVHEPTYEAFYLKVLSAFS